MQLFSLSVTVSVTVILIMLVVSVASFPLKKESHIYGTFASAEEQETPAKSVVVNVVALARYLKKPEIESDPISQDDSESEYDDEPEVEVDDPAATDTNSVEFDSDSDVLKPDATLAVVGSSASDAAGVSSDSESESLISTSSDSPDSAIMGAAVPVSLVATGLGTGAGLLGLRTMGTENLPVSIDDSFTSMESSNSASKERSPSMEIPSSTEIPSYTEIPPSTEIPSSTEVTSSTEILPPTEIPSSTITSTGDLTIPVIPASVAAAGAASGLAVLGTMNSNIPSYSESKSTIQDRPVPALNMAPIVAGIPGTVAGLLALHALDAHLVSQIKEPGEEAPECVNKEKDKQNDEKKETDASNTDTAASSALLQSTMTSNLGLSIFNAVAAAAQIILVVFMVEKRVTNKITIEINKVHENVEKQCDEIKKKLPDQKSPKSSPPPLPPMSERIVKLKSEPLQQTEKQPSPPKVDPGNIFTIEPVKAMEFIEPLVEPVKSEEYESENTPYVPPIVWPIPAYPDLPEPKSILERNRVSIMLQLDSDEDAGKNEIQPSEFQLNEAEPALEKNVITLRRSSVRVPFINQADSDHNTEHVNQTDNQSQALQANRSELVVIPSEPEPEPVIKSALLSLTLQPEQYVKELEADAANIPIPEEMVDDKQGTNKASEQQEEQAILVPQEMATLAPEQEEQQAVPVSQELAKLGPEQEEQQAVPASQEMVKKAPEQGEQHADLEPESHKTKSPEQPHKSSPEIQDEQGVPRARTIRPGRLVGLGLGRDREHPHVEKGLVQLPGNKEPHVTSEIHEIDRKRKPLSSKILTKP